jgi:hypothetical protein
MPFYWGPFGAYYYRLNETAPAPNNTASNTTASNSSDPVLCICENYQPCGCDNSANSSYTLPSDVEFAVINGTDYALVNGTLENSTTVTYPPSNATIDNGTTTVAGTASSGMSMGLFLTESGKWTSWIMFGVAAWLAIEAL